MNLNDLLLSKAIDPKDVIALRHRPYEPELRKILPWLAAEKPDVFNAYQQTQGEKLEKVMANMINHGYVASFIGHEPGKAVFVGLYKIGNTKSLTVEQYWQIPAYLEMRKSGMQGFNGEERQSILWFDLTLTDIFALWKGKLVVGWPPPERSWWRRSHRNEMPVLSILEESMFDDVMPKWDDIILSWEQLSFIPLRWKSALSQWRGIYYIFDTHDRKGYIGSAYGESNLYGRWMNYAKQGHGGNKLLKERDPKRFSFSILQRVSPDMTANEIVQIENSWKERLHTRQPFGLNEN
jgi:hypothetical protein